MVGISRQCPFGADKAVQISRVVFFDKWAHPELRQKMQNRHINQDVKSSLGLALLSSHFLNITILLNVRCTRNRKNVS